MRFTSLIVELIRARPLLVVWLVLLAQAALWLAVPLALFGAPPGDVAMVITHGRDYQVGSVLGPPLAFWTADLAYRAAGNHIVGVYLLAQICFVVTGRATGDDLPEAFEDPTRRFALGVQWHPEADETSRVIAALVAEARDYAAARE